MQLYEYQKQVARVLRSGKSVVLQAPTGSGKTFAALWPFLEAYDRKAADFPSKCIYVVPMRVLAHQFIDQTKKLLTSMALLKVPQLTIQTGDQPDDPRFEGDLIFCTIDQFLSSYLTMPYSLPNRLANLNAGALTGAYLVFDEFHLLDPGSTLPSTLYALKQLSRLAPTLLMTATFSQQMLSSLAGTLSADVVLLPQSEASAIELRNGVTQPRKRIWHVAETNLSAEAVLASHHARSLAICNTVKSAQTLFRELRQLKEDHKLETEIWLLHSRFLPDDRRVTEEKLRLLFGKDAERSSSIIAVATQTIEVGVDITCQTLHTELAPASALIQRAGRCARFPGEEGQVFVYPVASYLPYGKEKNDPDDDSLWVVEMKAALAWLRTHTGEVFNFETEQALVNAVAASRDKKILEELSAGRVQRAAAIQRALLGDRVADDSRLLVRNADNRLVLIHDNPDELLKNPLGATGFNLATLTLYGMVKEWNEREANVEWRVKCLIGGEKNADPSEDNQTEYGWKHLPDPQLLWSTRAIVVNPEFAGYWPDEGFVAERGDSDFRSSFPADVSTRTWDGLSYRLESYEKHIQRVLQAFVELALPELRYAAPALERAAGWQPGSMMRAAWLVCLFHDVGKLDKRWQAWARAYQQQIGRPIQSDFAAAHTDSDRNNPAHKEADKAVQFRHPKPHHAGESALATSPILRRALPDEFLFRAALTAITRHHTPFAKECELYGLEPQAHSHIQATLQFVPEEVRAYLDLTHLRTQVKTPPDAFSNLLVRPDDECGWLAYSLLARALRRADQEGTSRGTKD
jgi:CRISPR-associated endonuclease/helicase Cas3